MSLRISFEFGLFLSLILTIATAEENGTNSQHYSTSELHHSPRDALNVSTNDSTSQLLHSVDDASHSLLTQSLNDLTMNGSTSKYIIDQNNDHQDNRPNGNDDYNCGVPHIQRIKRIVGGKDSNFGQHPWQALLLHNETKSKTHVGFCGGVILNHRWVITAAHCAMRSKGSLKVRLGEFNVDVKEEELNYEEYIVEEKQIHPEYTRKHFKNDLALLKMDRIIYFDRHISPVCLPEPDSNVSGIMAVVTGWGRRKADQPASRPSILNKLDVEVFPNELCQTWFSKAGWRGNLTDIHLCAGSASGRSGSCDGDSGGPLTTVVEGKNILIGIASWNLHCDRDRQPGIYANVRKLLPWIRKRIG